MSLLQPELNNNLIDFEAVAAEAMNPPSDNSSKDEKSSFLKALDNHKAGLDAAARRISQVVNFPENEAMGLKAAEMILRANGILKEKEKDAKEAPQVNITVVSQSGQTMINLLMPKV